MIKNSVGGKIFGILFVTFCGISLYSLNWYWNEISFKVSILFPEGTSFFAADFREEASLPQLLRLKDLRDVKRKLENSPWVKEHSVEVSSSDEIRITCKLTEPVALIQHQDGKLRYLGPAGEEFGTVRTGGLSLPIIYSSLQTLNLRQVTSLLSIWNASIISKFYLLSGIRLVPERGFRFQVVVPSGEGRQRIWVDLGNEGDTQVALKLESLNQVLHTLLNKSTPIQEIDIGLAKKIVVKLASSF